MRVVKLSDHESRPSVGVAFFADHVLTEGDLDALHEKMADALAAKGAKFSHTLSGQELTVDQLKANKVRSYVIAANGKRFMMMARSESTISDFGGGVNFMFTAMK